MSSGSRDSSGSARQGRPHLEHCASTFDEHLPYCGVLYEPKPRPNSYEEALKGFRESDSSNVGLGNRVMFVDGKAAFLMKMWWLDQAKTLETIRDDVLQS